MKRAVDYKENSSERRTGSEQRYRAFIRTAKSGLDATLLDLWKRVGNLKVPFSLDADDDMAKFSFENARSFHICTNTRRFHRPTRTGKHPSVTVMLGGFKNEFNDPEGQLIPCDAAGRIDCCYFGMAEEESELALFYIEQLVELPGRTRANPAPANARVP